MKRGHILLEILCTVALVSVFTTLAVVGVGETKTKMQKRQLEMAARRFIMDCRAVQQRNMFAESDEGWRITITDNSDKYTFGKGGGVVETHHLSDSGCDGVIFKGNALDSIRFTGTGSVDDEKSILLMHRDNESLILTLNLQPVTGRIEISN